MLFLTCNQITRRSSSYILSYTLFHYNISLNVAKKIKALFCVNIKIILKKLFSFFYLLFTFYFLLFTFYFIILFNSYTQQLTHTQFIISVSHYVINYDKVIVIIAASVASGGLPIRRIQTPNFLSLSLSSRI